MTDEEYLADWLDTEWNASDRIIVAVDPGSSGAIAMIDTGGDSGNNACVVDMPTIKVDRSGGSKTKIDHPQLAKIVKLLMAEKTSTRVELVMERPQVHSFEIPGTQCRVCKRGRMVGSEYHGLQNGLNAGCFEAIAALCGWPYADYHPLTWKKALNLTKDKELSRAKARQWFPGCVERLERKKDEGRAEALLLGEFHRRKLAGVGAE